MPPITSVTEDDIQRDWLVATRGTASAQSLDDDGADDGAGGGDDGAGGDDDGGGGGDDGAGGDDAGVR